MNEREGNTAIQLDDENEDAAAYDLFRLFSDGPRYVESLLPLRGAELKRTLPQQISDVVSERIISDQLKPGARLTEQELAREFNVSHGPVREAIRILAGEGLVEVQPYRGAVVANMTRRQIRDVFDIRKKLWGLAVQRACERADDSVLERVRQSAEIMNTKEMNGGDRLVLAEITLGMVARSSQNEQLCELLRQSALQLYRYMVIAFKTSDHAREGILNWKRLADHMEQRDGAAAAAVVEQMVQNTCDAILMSLDDI